MWEQLAAVLHVPRVWWPYLASGGVPGLLNAAAMTVAMLGLTALANRVGLRLKFEHVLALEALGSVPGKGSLACWPAADRGD